MKRNIVSRHYFRRTARWKKKRLQRAQEYARTGDRVGRQILEDAGIDRDDRLDVEVSTRGPYRWVVVAY